MRQYDLTFDLRITVGYCDLYVMFQWFAIYPEDCMMSEHHTLGLWVSMTTFDLKISVGHCDLYFMVSDCRYGVSPENYPEWFCLISSRLFDVWTSYFGIMSQYDPTFDLKINDGHCDLYFMVQWFCLMFWRLFDVRTSYSGIMSQYDKTFEFQNKSRSLWPIFCGPVILPHILRTIWYMSTILWDYESVWPDVWPKNKCTCRSRWPIFHVPLNLPCILKTLWLYEHYAVIMI